MSSVKVMTYNIRYDNNWDTEHSWDSRKDLVVRNIKNDNPDIFGIQEGMINQVLYLKNNLHIYDYVGVGRGDGKEKDEFSAIFYNKEKYELLEGDTFWLSKTPEIPGSFGWDAACTRIMTWAKLKDKESNKIIYHFNTHFDHEGQVAQIESAKLVVEKIKQISNEQPVIMTGDLNLTPDSEVYKILTSLLTDVCKDKNGKIDKRITYTDFGKDKNWDRIDYIFVNNSIKVIDYKIHDDEEDGMVSSDHYRITANLII